MSSPDDKDQARPDIVERTVRFPASLYDELRYLAFRDRRKINDIIIELLDQALHPSTQ
jgi:hypothetical protein